jgi:hypothetical protein
MKREGRIHKGVSIGAYSILIAFMLLLLWTVLRYPGNHLIPWQMALGVAAATVLLLAAGAAWNKIYTVTGRRNSLYAVALVLFGVLLYVVSLSRQGNENTLLDYTYVYRDALNLANGRELEDTNYFLTYSNNLKPMLLLSVLFRMALLMDVSPFYFVLLRNVILVMLVACACGYLAERNGDTCWQKAPLHSILRACPYFPSVYNKIISNTVYNMCVIMVNYYFRGFSDKFFQKYSILRTLPSRIPGI